MVARTDMHEWRSDAIQMSSVYSGPVSRSPKMSDPNLVQILTEQSWYIGDYISSVLLGVQIALFIQSSYYLAYGPYSRKKKAIFIVYGAFLALFVGITNAGNQIQGLLMWIKHRDVPGGPEAYLEATTAAWWNVFSTSAIVTADIMGDALLMYRCYVLLSSNVWLIVLPSLLFITSSVLAILTVIESSLPNAFAFTGLSQSLGIPWVSLSVSLNVVVTSLICGRLLTSYFALKRVGYASIARERWGMVAILIESSLPFSVSGIVLAAFYGLPAMNPDSQLVGAFADTWGGVVGISPQLIILRVAMGNAWTENNVSSNPDSTNMKFERGLGSTTHVMKESTTSVMVDKEQVSNAASLPGIEHSHVFVISEAV
ncbi:hypothetical protein CVT26_003510 [Gymnopilus dilepis]|uniref:Uncharacterized protein n=1 Tax=Gymnopilus dilepis TaxID=231916 RepID=A0A409W2Y8_9AGAR|nr:hypothetical protein CVT26_003510 [Gymnopilus dilepis]